MNIVITGASSGIGEALARYYARQGVVLGITGRDTARLEVVAAACRKAGAVVEARGIDVSDRAAMGAWICDFDARYPITLLVANAGVGGGGAKDASPASFEAAYAMFAINIDGVCHTLHPVLPRMASRGGGQVALIASLAGYRGLSGAPAYSASKGFVKLYGEGLRGAMAPYGIKINVVCPGFVRSRITDQNTFRMPFFMEADEAARVIARGLEKNRARIAFPAPMAFAVWLMATLPAALSDWIAARLPKKTG